MKWICECEKILELILVNSNDLQSTKDFKQNFKGLPLQGHLCCTILYPYYTRDVKIRKLFIIVHYALTLTQQDYQNNNNGQPNPKATGLFLSTTYYLIFAIHIYHIVYYEWTSEFNDG